MIFSVEEVLEKAQKLYSKGAVFRAFIDDEKIFPLTIKLKIMKQKDIIDNYFKIAKEVEKFKKLKLGVEYKEFKFKVIGSQRLPTAVVFKKREEFLDFIAKKEEFDEYSLGYCKAIEVSSKLKELFKERPKLLLDSLQELDRILRVVTFFKENPRPNIYIRELPLVGVDTKFVEKNRKTLDLFLMTVLDKDFYNSTKESLLRNGFERKYGLRYKLPLVRFRILDCSLHVEGLSDLTINIDEFKSLNLACRRVFMVENEITALCFPNLKESIVIFAQGYGVGILREVEWLKNRDIYYWGDIDMDGFAILSQARGYFPHIKSLFMDIETAQEFKELGVKSGCKPYKKLDNLTREEMILYDRVFNDYYGENFRLEQEKLPVLDRLKEGQI